MIKAKRSSQASPARKAGNSKPTGRGGKSSDPPRRLDETDTLILRDLIAKESPQPPRK